MRLPVRLTHRPSSQERCVWCHDALSDAVVSCSLCRALFHPECVSANGRCPTLGCVAVPSRPQRRTRAWTGIRLWAAASVILLILGIVSAVHGVVSAVHGYSEESRSFEQPTREQVVAATARLQALYDSGDHRGVTRIWYPASSARAVALRGASYMWLGELRTARHLLEQAVARDPTDGWARMELGCVHYRQGDRAAAWAAFDHAIDLDPRLAKAWAFRAIVKLEEHADTLSAFTDADRAVSLDSRLAWGHAARAGAWLARGNPERAIQDANEALSIEASEWVWTIRGDAFAAIGDLDRALKDYDEAVCPDASCPARAKREAVIARLQK